MTNPISERWTAPTHLPRWYLDASALAKLYVRESDSDLLDEALDGREDLTTSDLSITEAISAAARRHREGTLSAPDLARVRSQLVADRDDGPYRCMSLVPELHREAERILVTVRAVPLRASDALHLAQAISARATVFLTFDRRLARAAEAVGLVVFPGPV